MTTVRCELTHAQWLEALGVDPFWIVDELPQSTPAAPVSLPVGDGQPDSSVLDADIRSCRQCGLARHRKQVVIGSGDVKAEWLLVGEAPGAEEDKAGLPFVGQSGKLLDAMLAALDLKRDQGVYLTSAVKCHPEENRAPTSDEVDTCNRFLYQQIAQIQPKVILALGRSAAYAVLGQEAPLQRLRGTVHYRQQDGLKIPVVVTYHPAYLLREPAEKWKTWQDLLLARKTVVS
jgi:uracil-DNA glycosylase family 4